MSSLKIRLPKKISDETASVVFDLLNELLYQWDVTYYVQISRFESARQRALYDPERPWERVRSTPHDDTVLDDELPF